MAYRISVEPFGEGWAVQPCAIDNPLVFHRGAAAEAAAKDLAEKLSLAGVDAVIEFRLRDGEIIRRFVCPRYRPSPPEALSSAIDMKRAKPADPQVPRAPRAA